MDSLTQITLGAAVGEAVLGKKVGNRAMLWGAVAGTIPDLDVFANFIMHEVNALAFHRGISHSIFFAVVAAPILGFLVHKFYASGIDRNRIFKGVMASVSILLFLLIFGLIIIPSLAIGNGLKPVPVLLLLILGTILFIRSKNYLTSNLSDLGSEATFKEWSWLFFWGLFTHAILDCFTTYGTQLFQPFSDFRVAFSNISVADPLYTIPFIIFLVAAAWMKRGDRKRAIVLWAGIGISSLYMTLTLVNKVHVTSVFKSSLAENGIQYNRFMTTPTIFNNFLWACIAEADSTYYYGIYSVFDSRQEVVMEPLEKNHHLLGEFGHSRQELEMLKWFTDNYYSVEKNSDGHVFFNDLRFGIITGVEKRPRKKVRDYVFKFKIEDKGDRLEIDQKRENPENIGEEFGKLWDRIKGR